MKLSLKRELSYRLCALMDSDFEEILGITLMEELHSKLIQLEKEILKECENEDTNEQPRGAVPRDLYPLLPTEAYHAKGASSQRTATLPD